MGGGWSPQSQNLCVQPSVYEVTTVLKYCLLMPEECHTDRQYLLGLVNHQIQGIDWEKNCENIEVTVLDTC